MYRLLIFLLLFVLFFDSYTKAQTPTNTQLNSIVKRLDSRVTKQDSVITDLIIKNKELLAENHVLRITLDTNSSTFDSYDTFISIFGILVGIALVAVPLLGYFLVFKPSESLRTRLEMIETTLPQKIEDKFGEYFGNFEKNKFKQEIRNLDDPKLYRQALTFLGNTTFRDVDDEDQRSIAEFLYKHKEIDQIEKGKLAVYLAIRPSDTSEKYFKSIIDNYDRTQPAMFGASLSYIIDNHFEDNQKYFESYLIASPHGHDILLQIFDDCIVRYFTRPISGNENLKDRKKKGERILNYFLNNKRIVDSTVGKERLHSDLYITRKDLLSEYPFIKSSYYYTKYFENGMRREIPHN